jgi:uncharacterized protein involved in outer membrane biogenesis
MQLNQGARIGVRIALAVLVLTLLYVGVGFWAVPSVLRSVLVERLPQSVSGAKVSVGPIHFNPLLFRLRIEKLQLQDAHDRPLAGFEALRVDFEPLKLLVGRYSFKLIELQAPDVQVHIGADGALNLASLAPRASATAPAAAQKGSMPKIHVGLLHIARGTASYEDASRAPLFAAQLEPFDIELRDFDTTVEAGRFVFSGASALGERIEWQGRLGIQPLASEGTVHVEGLRASTLGAYAGNELPCRIDSGKLDLTASYHLQLAPDLTGTVALDKLSISDLQIGPKDSEERWITIPALSVSGGVVDLARHSGQVQSVVLTGAAITAWRKPDGTLNLLDLAAPPSATPPSETPPSETPPSATPMATGGASTPPTVPVHTATSSPSAASSAPWQLELARFEVQDAVIQTEDRSVQPAAQLKIAPLSLVLEHLALDPTRSIHATLDAGLNDTGGLHVEGDLTPQPLTAALAVKLEKVDLRAAQPYVGLWTAMSLRSGKLSAETSIHYATASRPSAAPAPLLTVSGDIHLIDLHTVDNALHDDFINAGRIDVHGLLLTHNPDRLEIAAVRAEKPYARLIIAPDTSLNMSRVLKPSSATGPQAVQRAGSGTPGRAASIQPARPPSAPRSSQKSRARPVAITAASSPNQMPMKIHEVRIHRGELDFTDLSVTPNFSAGIKQLEGEIANLSSDPSSRARVDLAGNVDAFSPVTIKGEVNLLSAALYTDIAMSFRNMELSIFDPYSGKFAGYNIAKGKLTTELHYKVVGRMLDAQHHIVIDQLEFGDKTASKEAVSLPVKLAVALLKDRNGVIDINLPVGGSLDDPTFRIGPFIWKAILNICEKAVTAPFALLGRLIGGGPELQFVDFDPGSSRLDTAAADTMRALVKALNERPQLKIDVPIAASADLDKPALIDAALESQVQAEAAAGPAAPDRPSRSAAHAPRATGAGIAPAASGPTPSAAASSGTAATLSPEQRLQILTRLYQRVSGGPPVFSPAVLQIKSPAESITARTEFLSSALRERIASGDAELRALAEQRAQSVQQALLTDSGIDPARVFLVANDKATSKDGRVRLELSVH